MSKESAFSLVNVYQMAEAFGGPRFWVTRTTWQSTVARIVGVGLKTAPAPYFGSPPVVMDVYSKSGELRDGLARLGTAGTYKTWRLIDEPSWAQTAELRSLDNPAIAATIAKFDRRRARPGQADETGKQFLEVPFARKDEAKAFGAKWDSANKKWWVKKGDVKALVEAGKLGFLGTDEAG